MIKNISNLGDAALYCDFGTEVNKDINSKVIKLFETIREKNIEAINNLTPSYNKLIISFDLKITNFKKIKEIVENIKIKETQKLNSKKLQIPVCCDSSVSLDIERLEKKLNLDREQILEVFFNKEFFCYMTGFIAGMPFLGDLEEKMRAFYESYEGKKKRPRVVFPVDLMFEDGSSLTVNSVEEMKQAWKDNCRKRGNDDEGEGEGGGTRG